MLDHSTEIRNAAANRRATTTETETQRISRAHSHSDSHRVHRPWCPLKSDPKVTLPLFRESCPLAISTRQITTWQAAGPSDKTDTRATGRNKLLLRELVFENHSQNAPQEHRLRKNGVPGIQYEADFRSAIRVLFAGRNVRK